MKNIVLGRDNIDVFVFVRTWFSDCSYLAASIEYADDDAHHYDGIIPFRCVEICSVCDFRNEKKGGDWPNMSSLIPSIFIRLKMRFVGSNNRYVMR